LSVSDLAIMRQLSRQPIRNAIGRHVQCSMSDLAYLND
jgi:hypothetical protein